MTEQQLNTMLAKAKEHCKASGGKLTEKRRGVLEVLLRSNEPLSAYEITDCYNKASIKPMPAMSVYRILDFLEEEHLAHKLTSTNKYVACSHGSCSSLSNKTQFLICSKCNSVKEVSIPQNILDQLAQNISGFGCRLKQSHLELSCICDRCSQPLN